MFLQVSAAVPSTVLDLVRNATPFSKAVLAVLAVLSLTSWAVMLSKWFTFRRVERAARKFTGEFQKARRLEDVAALARRAKESAHTLVLERALQFLVETRVVKDDAGGPATLSASQVQALRLVLDA